MSNPSPSSRRTYKPARVRDFSDNLYTVDDLMIRFDARREWVLEHFVRPEPPPIPYRKVGTTYIWYLPHIEQWVADAAKLNDTPSSS